MKFFWSMLLSILISANIYGQQAVKDGLNVGANGHEFMIEMAFNRGFNDGLRNRVFHNDYYNDTFKKQAYGEGYAHAVLTRKKGTHWYLNPGVKSEDITDISGLKYVEAFKLLTQRSFIEVASYDHGSSVYTIWKNPSTTQWITMVSFNDRISEVLISPRAIREHSNRGIE